ncbi:hypothetical protein HMI54_004350 [Coelomomyces lativittatus]|nr:hypothetical protein HMI55_002151 [Coelomomyces lativittatus]KAJ1506704.1 hypothetical protein HMI56_000477 [Coelomomyces lativittatus]KAJ1507242.1 hypothetical protein HMI54_004350 [Coelomomyces lativittatus]
MRKYETIKRVGDAQLEAFERKRALSRTPQDFSVSTSFTEPTDPKLLPETVKPNSPSIMIPPPSTKLFPNPERLLNESIKSESNSESGVPISPVSLTNTEEIVSIPHPFIQKPSPPSTTSLSNKMMSVSLKPTENIHLSTKPNLEIAASKFDESKAFPTSPKEKDSPFNTTLSFQPVTSPQQMTSLGSMLIMNGQQKVHLIETQFRLLTQSFKEKVAQPLFGTETQVTRFQDAEEAAMALEQMQVLYTKLQEHITNYHRLLQQVQECESGMARMMLDWGYKSPPESELGGSLVTFGTAYQSQSNALTAYIKSISMFRDQLKVFLQHALKDAQDTRKKQEEARKEWDAAHLKLLPSLKLRNSENEKVMSWIPGLSSFHGSTSTTFPTTTTMTTPALLNEPQGPPPQVKSVHLHRSPTEDEGALHLGQKLGDLTTGFVKKCAILQAKSASDLTQQLWTLRKHSALYHSNALDSMMSSSNS